MISAPDVDTCDMVQGEDIHRLFTPGPSLAYWWQRLETSTCIRRTGRVTLRPVHVSGVLVRSLVHVSGVLVAASSDQYMYQAYW